MLLSGGTALASPLATASSPSQATVATDSNVVIPVLSAVVAGKRVFYMRMRIGGGPETNVILDTGSIGLRALASVVPQRDPAGAPIIYGYESGNELHGHVSTESVSVAGRVLGTVPVQVVDTLSCSPRMPHCPASALQDNPLAHGVDGISSADFGAIMGILLIKPQTLPVPNPLIAAGFHRWLVQLPQRDGWRGVLVLNPPMAQLDGFTRLNVDQNGAVAACLDSGGGEPALCLPTVLDSGEPHVFIYQSKAAEQDFVPAGSPVTLTFSDTAATGQELAFGFTAASTAAAGASGQLRRDPAVVSFEQLGFLYTTQPFINAGYLPFWFYSVLFDADAQEIGLRQTPLPLNTDDMIKAYQ